mgnify:CR=1 FL=1
MCLKEDTCDKFYFRCSGDSVFSFIRINVYKNKNIHESYIEIYSNRVYIDIGDALCISVGSDFVKNKDLSVEVLDISHINQNNYYEILGNILDVCKRYYINSILE